MANILVKGIARYVHAFTPSAPPGTNERRYSIDVLVHKSDTEFLPAAYAALEADKQATFPGGAPARADFFITDLATVTPALDPRLHEYVSVRFSTKEADGAPSIVNAQRQPVINPGELQPGDVVYVAGNTIGYTVGSQGVKAYLNGIMLTGQRGSIPQELLSARPSAEQMFANVPAGAPAQPQYNTQGQLPPAPQAEAPAAAAPPPAPVPPAPAAPPTAQFTMTPAANGTTREAYHAAGWTDEQLISNGLMLPPGGVTPSFMG